MASFGRGQNALTLSPSQSEELLQSLSQTMVTPFLLPREPHRLGRPVAHPAYCWSVHDSYYIFSPLWGCDTQKAPLSFRFGHTLELKVKMIGT